MASRVKEEEKNEKAIRALLKKEPNRRCINCNSLVRTNSFSSLCFPCKTDGHLKYRLIDAVFYLRKNSWAWFEDILCSCPV
jgi:hypothetical protein